MQRGLHASHPAAPSSNLGSAVSLYFSVYEQFWDWTHLVQQGISQMQLATTSQAKIIFRADFCSELCPTGLDPWSIKVGVHFLKSDSWTWKFTKKVFAYLIGYMIQNPKVYETSIHELKASCVIMGGTIDSLTCLKVGFELVRSKV